jgi:hypothetical protein
MAAGNSDDERDVTHKILSQKNTYDTIVQTIEEDRERYLITETVEEQLDMMYNVRQLFVMYNSRFRVIKELINSGIPATTARRLADITPQLFSVSLKRGFARDFHVDNLLESIAQTRRLALAKGDITGMNKADANYMAAIEKFTGTKELVDQDELHLPDVEIAFRDEWFPELPAVTSSDFQKIKDSFYRRLERRKKITDTEYEDL